jgi:dTDP-4-dehydrorhamnose reductase
MSDNVQDKKSQRVLILGANGQLGVELQRRFADYGQVIALGRDRCNLADLSQIRKSVAEAKPTVILNAAAYTAVDRAESEQELAMRVNGEASGVIAEEARKVSAILVHYSTDYVFDGSKTTPWVEDDKTGPLNVYGASKLDGERRIAEAGGNYLVFRTSWVISPHGQNFLRTMLRLGAEREQLKIVDDQTGAPTTAYEIAKATRLVLEEIESKRIEGCSGIYHMTCAGETTWCGFAQTIFELAKSSSGKWAAVTGIGSAEYPTPAKRPKNSVLSNEKLRAAFGVQLESWESALKQTLHTLDIGR